MSLFTDTCHPLSKIKHFLTFLIFELILPVEIRNLFLNKEQPLPEHSIPSPEYPFGQGSHLNPVLFAGAGRSLQVTPG